jgi:hypothetical protein
MPRLQPPQKPPTLMSVLAVDAMYFQAAQQALSRASSCTERIDRSRGVIENLQDRISALSCGSDGERDVRIVSRNYNKLEPLYVQIEDAEYLLGEGYGPMLQDLAAVHILCVASAEAHINIRAQDRLCGRDWGTFERLLVDAKWLFLPKLLSLPGFDPSRQPFQDFDLLLKVRNKLTHYRKQKEPWDSPDVPEFLTTLGLNLESGERSVKAVREMLLALAQQLQQEPPYWFTRERENFFELTFEKA